jgi:hypothetical protein
MFQFTTTKVINSQDAWLKVSDDEFLVKYGLSFKKDNVKDFFKAEAQDEKLSSLTVDLSGLDSLDLKKGDTLRIDLYIHLSQGSNSSFYANDTYYKGRPFFLDFAWAGTAESTLKKLVSLIKKYQLDIYGEKFIDITYEGSVLTINAVDEYQRFTKFALSKYNPKVLRGLGDYEVIYDIDSDEVTLDQGHEGFGTYTFILHNLRLPTTAHTNWKAIGQEEMPIIGAKYNQYTIHYLTNRGIMGMHAVGQVAQSLTTHVLYVRQDLATQFEQDIAAVLGEPTDATHKEDSEASEQTSAAIEDSDE